MISVDKSYSLQFRILVPASYITEPVNVKTYDVFINMSVPNHQLDQVKVIIRGPLPEHPRLLVRQNELKSLRVNMNHPDFVEVRKAFQEQKDYKTDGIRADQRPSEKVSQAMEALAYEYLLNGKSKQESGEKAVNLAINYLSTITDTRGYWANVFAYDAVLGSAFVYDWCYDLLSKQQKLTLIREMKRVCALCEYYYPGHTPAEYFSGHYGEQAPTVFLAMGIAMFDEDSELFDFEYDEQVNHFAPSRNAMYKAGTHHQGSQYMHSRYVNEILQAFILDKIGLNCYDPASALLSYRGLYLTIPQKKEMDGMPDGDCHNEIFMGYQGYFLSAKMSKDPFLQVLSKKYLPKQLNQSTRLFIYHNPDIVPKKLEELTLSRFFPSPSGIMMARTKWDLDSVGFGSNAMVVQMNMKEYNSRNHDHSDAGHFGIYYKGHLALDAGIYQGEDPENGWGKRNFLNYYTRTIAHNSILVLDPNEPLPYGGGNKKCDSRDGGQFVLKPDAWKSSQEMFSKGKVSQILAHEIAPGTQPDYTYLKGDMTSGYIVPDYIDSIYPAKVDTVRRSFVFLNLHSDHIPGCLIVLDKVVSTNPDFRKSWLLHSQNEPLIQDNSIEFSNTTDGRNGKLHVSVLLPESGNLVIDKIGGAGKEYFVDGKNWGAVTQQDAGCWRIELGFSKPSLSDNYLNVIQAMDANPSPKPIVVTKALSAKGNYVVVEIANRIVAQSLTLDASRNEISFEKGEKGRDYEVLVTDLSVGKWHVKGPAKTKDFIVSKDAGTISFKEKGGRFLLKYIGE